MKMLQKQIKKANKIIKCVCQFLNKTNKNYNNMKNQIKKILLLAVVITATACGTTKVTVNKPDNGTYTQITVTTNNPISTSTDAKAQLTGKEE